MPIYEYHCDACNKDFEELVFGDAVPPAPIAAQAQRTN